MFGANTVIPAATMAWCCGLNVGRSCASGPPCRLSIAGPGPIWPRGRYSQPVRANPSRPKKNSSVGTTSATSGSGGPWVTRVHTRVAVSSRRICRGRRGPSTLITAVLPSRLSRAPVTTSPDSSGAVLTSLVRGSSSTTSLPPPATFQTSISNWPASSASSPSSSASSRGDSTPASPRQPAGPSGMATSCRRGRAASLAR